MGVEPRKRQASVTGSRGRSLVRWVGAVAFVVALVGTPFLWARLDAWVQVQRDELWRQVETAVGHPILYDRIAPNVLAALDFQNVRLVTNGTPLVTAASIRLSLDWDKVLRGNVTGALRRIQVINATVNLDSRRDQDLLDRWAGFVQGTGAPGESLPRFEVEWFNLSGHWTDGSRSLGLERGFVQLQFDRGRWGLKYRGALAARGPGWAGALNVRGELLADDGFRFLTARTEVNHVKTTWCDVEPLTLQLSLAPTAVTITKVADRIPLDLQIVWDRLADLWTVRGAAEGFVPATVLHWNQNPGWAGWARGTFTGKFSFQPGGDFTLNGNATWPSGVLPAPFDQGEVVAEGAVRTEGPMYRFEGFHLRAPGVALSYDGALDTKTLLPEGQLDLERWTVPGVGTAQGRLQMVRDGNRVQLSGSDLRWNDLGTANPSGWVERQGRLWAFSFQGPWDGTSGRFSFDGTWDPAESRLNAVAKVDGLPLALAAGELKAHVKGWELPVEVQDLVADLSARVDWSPSRLAVTEGLFSFRDPNRPRRSAQGSLALDSQFLRVSLDALEWDDLTAHGQASALFQPNGEVNWTLGATVLGRNVDLIGRWNAQQNLLTFSGTPGLRGTVRRGSLENWSGELTVDPLEIVPGWTLGFHVTASLADQRWAVEGDRVELTGRYPWNREVFHLRSTLAADADFLRLGDLVVTDSKGSLVGNLVTTWSPDFSQAWSGRAVLATPQTSRESVEALWTISTVRRAHVSLKGTGLDLARAGLPGVQGRIAANGDVDVEDGALRWSGQMALSEARWGESPLGFRASFSGDDGQVSVRNLNLSVSPFRVSDGSLDGDWASQTWKASLGMGVRLGASDWTSSWTAAGALGADSFTVQLKAVKNVWAKKAFSDWTLSGRWTPAGWNASLSDRGLVAEGTPDGRFRVVAQAPLPVAGQITGTWKDAQISAVVQGLQADVTLASEFVNTPAFSLTGGTLSGVFTVEGNPLDPEVNGSLVFQRLRATSSFVRQPIGPLDVPVVLEGHRVTLAPVNAGPPGRTWLVSGAARLDHFLPEEYQLTVQMDPLSEIPFSYQMTGISAKGGVTGLLVIRGTPLAVTLGGRLVLQDTTITLKDSPSTPGGAGTLGFNADLTLVTGRKVEFLWPNENVPLLRAVGTPNQVLAIKANDVASTWSVVGTLGLKTGEVNYLSRTFVIKEGQLGFQESQAGFDPRINVRAEWRYRETTGTTIVSLKADGFLSKFSPRFEATPFKTAEELNQLVGTTLALPNDYTRSNSSDTALSLASDVGTSFLLSPFEETVKKNFNLDLFTVKTEILKKSLLNRNGPVEASDYLDNTRLFFGKYVGDDLFLQGTLAFRQDDTVAGQANPKMVVEPELQMEFQTPFFLLNWTLLPQHPETLFVADNTVTFRWDWSY